MKSIKHQWVDYNNRLERSDMFSRNSISQQKALWQLLLLSLKALWKAPEAYLSHHANVSSQQGLFVWPHSSEGAALTRTRRNKDVILRTLVVHAVVILPLNRSSLLAANVQCQSLADFVLARPAASPQLLSVGKLVHWWLAYSWPRNCKNPV